MKKVAYIICKILTLINRIIPKDKKKIILYSNLGFRDNVEAMYIYLCENNYQKKYKIIVSSNDYKKITHVNGIKYIGCIRGVFYFLISRYFFYSFGKYPIMPSKEQIVVNLWHGMPLKTIGNMEKGKEKIKYDYFSYVISTSKCFNDIMMKSFNCNSDRIMNIGQPRTDYFYKKKINIFNEYKKIVIWMPTFRTTDILHESNTSDKNNILPLVKCIDDFKKINKIFKENNSLLIIKLHPIQSKSNFFYKNQSNILFIDEEYLREKGLKLYEFLANTDSLITDYSSVYFDYLLLNKPIIFTIADLDDYKDNRGLNFNKLEEIMPGPKVSSTEEYINELKNILNGEDKFIETRKKVNLILNEYVTKNNCEKICDLCDL